MRVTHDTTGSTYVAFDNDEVAALTRYIDRGNQRIFIHTETEPGFEHHGIATELICQALTATRADGMRIVAVCPFVAAFVDEHHDFDDILDRRQPHTQPE